MLEKWARLLPYWILMWAVRNWSNSDGSGKLIFGKNTEYDIKYFQLSEGEFVVFSKEIQDRFDARKESKRKKKLDKKLYKLNKQLRGDYCLKSELIKQFEDEKMYE
ncbi:MAG: hypothetical protein KAS66_07520 [Candidatus Omnitrophica bacterium]|nr:hypothetical protein [Candidatus Omnitrophota bacterium]